MIFLKIAIEIKNLNAWFGTKQVLFNINLRIPKNTITAIMGPSGCGKTTLLKCINRLNDLNEDFRMNGMILIDGKNIYDSDVDVTELRKRVGMVFQKPNPFPMSIYDNIAFGLRIHGIKDRRKIDEIVEKSLKKVALWEEVKNRLKDNALKLSGGQQQRLCIARVLALNPEIILMDEPTSALDPISARKIEDLLIELKKNYTIIIVTHNVQQAARVSDYVAFLYLGKLIEFGITEEVFKRPKHKLTESFITGKIG